MNRWIGVVGCAVGCGLSSVPTIAWGQQSLEVTRRELMQQAQAEALAGHPVRALDLASRAGQIQMTPSLRSFIAQQQLVNHLPVEAVANGQMCVREVTGDATLRNREAILSACQEVVASAQSQLGHVNVHLDPAHAPVQVRVAGTVLSEAVLGIPFAVDPGEVVIEASGLASSLTVRPCAWSPGKRTMYSSRCARRSSGTPRPCPKPGCAPLQRRLHGPLTAALPWLRSHSGSVAAPH